MTESAFNQEYSALLDQLGRQRVPARGGSRYGYGPGTRPEAGHDYVIGTNWGRSNDFTVFLVLDVTAKAVVAMDRSNPTPRARWPAGAHPGGAGAPRRAGDGGRQRAPRRQRPQAVRRRGRRRDRAAGRRPRRRSRATRAPARRRSRPMRRAASCRENAEFVPIALLAQDWDSIAGWLVEELFADEVYRRAFLALGGGRRRPRRRDRARPTPRRARCSSGRPSPTSRSIPRPRPAT